MSRRGCLARRPEASHLFTCPACRADARIGQAWTALPRPETLEAPVVDALFVETVLEALRRDRVRTRRLRALAAAAAALLFFFFAGLAHERASKPAANAEEAYASLASPGTLEGLIPN